MSEPTEQPEPPPPFRLSRHAEFAIQRRSIDPAWIAAVLAEPAMVEPDQIDPAATHAYRPIPEFDGRVLRVVYNHTEKPLVIITAFFDRSRMGTL